MAQCGLPQEMAFNYSLAGFEVPADYGWLGRSDLSADPYRYEMYQPRQPTETIELSSYDLEESILSTLFSTGSDSVANEHTMVEEPVISAPIIVQTWPDVDRASNAVSPNNTSPGNLADVEDVKPSIMNLDVDETREKQEADEASEASSSSSSSSSSPSSPEWEPATRNSHPRASKTHARAVQKRLANDYLEGRIEESSLIEPPPVKKRATRKKLYELGVFADPALERCRQNAINAKRNRDLRKQEKEALSEQMTALSETNRQLKQTLDSIAAVLSRHGLTHLLDEATMQSGSGLAAGAGAGATCGRQHRTEQTRSACSACANARRNNFK